MHFRHKVIATACLFALLGIYLAADAASKRKATKARIEVRIRMHLLGIVGRQIEPGLKLPSSWEEFPKPAAWQHIHTLAERHGLSPPTELYAILRNPVVDPYFSDQKIWLIRAYPDTNYKPPLRWGLAISNAVIVPVEIVEQDVSQEILSQINGPRK